MKPGATLWEKFEGWFCNPIDKLKECGDEGDGGFLAMSAALFLCERYYRTITNTHEGDAAKDSNSFRKEAARDMNINAEDFEKFWKVYRHGIQHQGMPKVIQEKGITYIWQFGAKFSAIPIFHPVNYTTQAIGVDPWKFAELIKSKYRTNPDVLKKATEHAFGEVYLN